MMKNTLYLKFIILYVIFGFLSVFTISLFSREIVYSSLEKSTADTLYTQANLFSTRYLPKYFSGEATLADTTLQLDGLNSHLHAFAWFIDRDGNMITSSQFSSANHAPSHVKDFNPLESSENNHEPYLFGNYHGYFDENVITVVAPVTSTFSTKGYFLLHKPVSDITKQYNFIVRSIYFMFLLIYLFSFLIFLGIHFLVYLPLRKITEAAKQYASGNLEYEIPVHTEDEIGYLSASLNYMSSQLKDMEDYQKKFIGNVSHDFRSPLTSIKGYVEAISDGTIPPQLQEKYLKIILFETERLTELTHDLLTLNEFDTKELLLNKTTFNLHEVIKLTAESFEGRCTTKHITIELRFPSKTLFAFADRSKIQQVLYNLLDNAIKFSPEDSLITIETSERGNHLFVSVKDHGVGIPKNSLGKIWERFYKTDFSRGKDKKGTGLGLAIVKEIMLAHRENINVVSTEGVGTEFIFSLPKGSAEA